MAKGLTKKQQELYDYLCTLEEVPGMKEIGFHLKQDKVVIWNRCMTLVDKGYLEHNRPFTVIKKELIPIKK